MRGIRSTGLYVLMMAAALAAANGSASANCTASQIAGKWHFFAMEGQSPNIKSTSATVRNSADKGSVTVRVFPNSGTPFENSTATAIQCEFTLSGNGTLTSAPCTAYGVSPDDGGPVNVTGQFVFGTSTTTNGCTITGGSLNVPNDSPAVTVLGGYVKSGQGSGIARQGARRVYLFNLIKH